MSAMAAIAAHLIALPVRYTVGSWNDISTSTLIAFNTANISLNILTRSIESYVINSWRLDLSDHQYLGLIISTRILTCLTAVYITNRITNPIPKRCAAMTSLAASLSIIVGFRIVKSFKGNA